MIFDGMIFRERCQAVSETNEPRRLGDFQLGRELGRGGMGVVYEARQVSLNRPVALKVLSGGLGLTPKAVQRFHREAEAAARLHHTNIVPVYATGEENGTHFYAMELIAGASLDHVIRQMRQGAASGGRQPTDSAGHQGAGAPRSPDLAQTGPYVPGSDTTGSTVELSSSSLSSGGEYFDTVARRIAEVADALEYAHRQGVIHRDIKPSNLLLSSEGRLSINDFGLARMLEQPGMTLTGEFVGTPAYMSPEQITAGRIPLDQRTDIYSLGATLYELLTLQRPFQGEQRDQILAQIIQKEPKPPRQVNKKVPVDLDTICMKCLEKDPDRRYRTAAELAEDLRRYVQRFAISARRAGPVTKLVKFVRRHKLAVSAAVVIVLLAPTAAIALWNYRASQVRLAEERTRAEGEQWVREHAIPTLRRLIEQKDYAGAFDLALEAERRAPGDPTLQELRPEFASTWSVTTNPPGAELYTKPYQAIAAGGWKHVGRSPLVQIALPRGLLRWKIVKQGYATVEGCAAPEDGVAQFTLDKQDDLPRGMVRIAGNRFRINLPGGQGLEKIDLEDFFIDRHEVTNRAYKHFVEQGGYRKREFWKHSFIKGGQEVSWEAAMKEFRDATGQPGPSVWRLGSYPAGEADYPVGGISWYEAAAYAEFAGKSLPTVAHWLRASGIHYFQKAANRENNDPSRPWELGHVGQILRLSNIGSASPAAVGSHQGIGPFGTYDMAGNVKEWCRNKADIQTRYILGGAWDEPGYMFYIADVQSAFRRSASNGVRCVRLLSDKAPDAALADLPIARPRTGQQTPVSDETFRIMKVIYTHDKQAPLHSQVKVREETADWIHETIAFDAAYGNERVMAHLYLPRQGKPPYQAVVHFPGIGSWEEGIFSSKEWRFSGIPALVKSGRAVLWPIYKGTFERRFALKPGWAFLRESRIQLAKDLGRSLDYLEQRPDIDRAKLAYYGFSFGAALGNIHLALDDRFRVGVLVSGGMWQTTSHPEIDPLNFAPRVKIPVLMLGGRSDTVFPLESSQILMYELLGSPKKDKRHITLDAGHILPQETVDKEMIAWLDRYLGPVR
jgi:serine/threonine protein kinase/formylglycine-generating enzyme required for sulfatase activity/cephalosporin-C deacetylase-like acetyl esterase